MKHPGFVVYIVEDDASVRDALGLFLSMKGYVVAVYADAESFLLAFRPEWRGCLLLDIRMPGMSGLELQRELAAQQHTIPAIIMTGHGDIDSAREAFRANAVDFLEKPLDHEKLIAAIEDAFLRQEEHFDAGQRQEEMARLVSLLTPREKEILELVIERRHNREIAQRLDISIRTVEVHRSRIMSKIRGNGLPDLARLGALAERTGNL